MCVCVFVWCCDCGLKDVMFGFVLLCRSCGWMCWLQVIVRGLIVCKQCSWCVWCMCVFVDVMLYCDVGRFFVGAVFL